MRGEDPKTSRASEIQQEQFQDFVAAHWNDKQGEKQQGEDLRTSRVFSTNASKEEQGEDLRTSRENQEPQSQVGGQVGGIGGNTLASQATLVFPIAPPADAMALENFGKPTELSGDDGMDSCNVFMLSSADDSERGEFQVEHSIFRSPQSLVQYSDEPCLVIVDTGCQRQVAGRAWHETHAGHLELPRLAFKEKCQFRFGPSMSTTSTERYAYPSGLGKHFVVMFFSCVDANAPALMSRQTLTILDAVPDIISAGKIHYRALNATATLYLSSCGHLAVRLDEWPQQLPQWPCQMAVDSKCLPDVWAPSAKPVQAQELPSARHPVNSPPDASPSTGMVEEMAKVDDACADLARQRVQVSAAVCGH